MNPVLLFVAACAAIVAGGWIVSKFTGSRAYFIETWAYDAGETIVWRDDKADVAIIPKMGQAVFMTPLRAHRWPVVVTNRRILIGNKTFSGKGMVKYVLYSGTAPDDQSKRADGGLLTRGYSTLVIEPGVMEVGPELPSYVALTPVDLEPSSVNLSEIRIYSDLVASFRLP